MPTHGFGSLDVYLRSVSGRSLPVALAAGHEFGDDAVEFRPDTKAYREALDRLGAAVEERLLAYVHEEGFLLRVGGYPQQLSRVSSILAGLEVEAIEPAERWEVVATPPSLGCAVVGHDWDIVVFVSPFGVLKCWRCGNDAGPGES